ncbi:OmpA family protein [Dinghuibacter silviterrae]|uniref:OmpA family protein n=1 Tax=Dinghuibacter silviterrae TaxID=1539049 RepID=A0A4R8DG47_9BACT|nr:OmpA family protein [Dinghuibacter silviterrae]TDW96599.1 OmpA family protein [Dinghuibacter silviterrae]
MKTILACLVLCCVKGYGQKADTLTLLFPYNQSILAPGDTARIKGFMHLPPGRVMTGLSLAGHCDNIGGDPYNDSLSQARVDAVRRYLRGLGIADTLLRTTRGYGKRQPLNDNGSEEKRALNRRVEMIRYTGTATGLRTGPGDSVSRGGDSLIEWNEGPLSALFKDPASMPGKTVVLRSVNFYGGHHYPEPSSYKALNELIRLMAEQKGLQIEIQGFVCCLPDSVDALDLDTHIINLSTARARFIYDYLGAHGIDTARMRYKGFQASYKLYPDERNERERGANRRVQIRVIAWKPG